MTFGLINRTRGAVKLSGDAKFLRSYRHSLIKQNMGEWFFFPFSVIITSVRTASYRDYMERRIFTLKRGIPIFIDKE